MEDGKHNDPLKGGGDATMYTLHIAVAVPTLPTFYIRDS